MRQQLHPLAQRRVLFVEPIDLVAEFVEDCLGLCAAWSYPVSVEGEEFGVTGCELWVLS